MASLSSIKSTLGGLCTPAQLYLALSVIALIFVAINSFSITTIIIKLIFIALWTFVLNWICSKGYTSISWVLVLLPYIMFLLMFLVALDVSAKTAKHSMHESRPQEKVAQPSTIVQVPGQVPVPPSAQPLHMNSMNSMNSISSTNL